MNRTILPGREFRLKFKGVGMEEFKTRVKNESDMDAWESSEAYDVSIMSLLVEIKLNVHLQRF